MWTELSADPHPVRVGRRSFITRVLLALMTIVLSSTGGMASQTSETAQTLADLDPDAIYSEAKARGVDLLSPGAAPALRESFVALHAASANSGGQLLAEDRPWTRMARVLAKALGESNLISTVRVRTMKPGALVKYRLIGESQVIASVRLTNATEELVTIGLYNVWAERGGRATTSDSFVYRIIRPTILIDLVE